MKVIVTCGPSFEPIDEVRRITNFSTGELGVLLSEQLGQMGFEVICLRGTAATYPADPSDATVIPFSTNDDLEMRLADLSMEGGVVGVFHAAALCDYRVCQVADRIGRRLAGGKIPSRHGTLTLTLEPATKIISKMRAWFPDSQIVGWKYELEGTIESVLRNASRQMVENRIDACVVNGRAFGPGYGFCREHRSLKHLPSKITLCRFLAAWLLETVILEGPGAKNTSSSLAQMMDAPFRNLRMA